MRTFSMIVIAAAIGGGCARRAHTRGDFGVANRMFFDRQARAASRGQAQGLDSEEAAAIHQDYRRTLGKRDAAQANDPRSSVMILQEDRREAAKQK